MSAQYSGLTWNGSFFITKTLSNKGAVANKNKSKRDNNENKNKKTWIILRESNMKIWLVLMWKWNTKSNRIKWKVNYKNDFVS